MLLFTIFLLTLCGLRCQNKKCMTEERIIRINIEEEMKSAYIDYSMSVIVSRALPDVRDGLKPVHRRILFDMNNELSLHADKPHKKSARIVGDVLGKFHPHGDSSVYNAMARMAQPWSLRYTLVDGQGNFGSMDGDSPAAMRYTEARMKRITEEVIADIDKETVDFSNNFDDTMREPDVLPTRVPLLLVNGTNGIAVGMATNMPPHNLGEVIDGCCAYIDNPEIEIEELCNHIKGPDFPTGAMIYGYEGVRQAYMTGRGRAVMRSRAEIEVGDNGREKIVITEIPYMVNKSEMIKKIAELVNNKKIEGIADINDESSRVGVRVVIELKSDAVSSVVLNMLYKYSDLQTSFPINSIALVNGRPMILNLKDQIKYFIEHRHDVIVRRTRYLLTQAEKRAHILQGLLTAIDNIDRVISIIRSSPTVDVAKATLIEQFELSDIQSSAIVDMRLRALTGLERDKITADYNEQCALIANYTSILGDESLQMGIIKEELVEVKERFGDERRTEIIYSSEEFNPEDFYADEEVVITISHMGYIKRTPLTEYRTQSRGGVGAKGSATRDADFIEHIYVTTMHNTMLLFTELGRCFWLKVYQIPEGSRSSKGRALQNVIQITPNDKVRAYINVRQLTDSEYINNNYIVMATKAGIIKKTKLVEYSRPRANGVNAITIKEGDELLSAVLTNGTNEILLASRQGKAIRFNEKTVRSVGRNSQGVRGIDISDDNEVIGMITAEAGVDIEVLVVSEKGYGKRTSLEDYRITNRGAKGVKTIQITEKTGNLISLQKVTDNDDLMIINKSGMTIRIPVSEIRVTGRAAQGVRVINLKGSDSIASIVPVPKSEEPEELEAIEGATIEGATVESSEMVDTSLDTMVEVALEQQEEELQVEASQEVEE